MHIENDEDAIVMEVYKVIIIALIYDLGFIFTKTGKQHSGFVDLFLVAPERFVTVYQRMCLFFMQVKH